MRRAQDRADQLPRCERIRAIARTSGHLVHAIRTHHPRANEFEFLVREFAVVCHLKTPVLSGRLAFCLRRLLSPYIPCRSADGTHDLVVARATAQVAGQ